MTVIAEVLSWAVCIAAMAVLWPVFFPNEKPRGQRG